MARKTVTKIARACPTCGATFHRYACQLTNGRGVYCSKACADQSFRGRTLIDRTCEACGVAFVVPPDVVRRGEGRFCSVRCGAQQRSIQKVACRCLHCNAAMNIFPSHAKTGRGKYCSSRCYALARRRDRGEERDGAIYRDWRTAVFERDNYTCTDCGARGVVLTAHHIVHWADSVALRFEVSNGRTMCKTCHEALHGFALSMYK